MRVSCVKSWVRRTTPSSTTCCTARSGGRKKSSLFHSLTCRFCSYDQARFFVTTFNVNGRSPPEYLGGWLEFDNENLPDFVVVG